MPQDSNRLIQLGITDLSYAIDFNFPDTGDFESHREWLWLVITSSALNLDVLRHGDLSRSANGSGSKTSRGVHSQHANTANPY
jgi:hypothetical protein